MLLLAGLALLVVAYNYSYQYVAAAAIVNSHTPDPYTFRALSAEMFLFLVPAIMVLVVSAAFSMYYLYAFEKKLDALLKKDKPSP